MLKFIYMKKIIILLLVLSSMILVATAQNDPNAKKILDEVSAKFKTFKTPEASFTYELKNVRGEVISTKKGAVSMKESIYRVLMTGLEIFSDGETSWSYDKSANTVTIENVKTSSGAITPSQLFTNFHDKNFCIS